MIASPHTRKWTLLLALPILTIATTLRADDAEREEILAAIDAVNVKIDQTLVKIDDLSIEIEKIEKEIVELEKLVNETKDDAAKRALRTAQQKRKARISQRTSFEVALQEYYVTLDQLEKILADLGG